MQNSFLDVVPETESPSWAYPLFQSTDYYPKELKRLMGLKQHGPGLGYYLGPSERSRFDHSVSTGGLAMRSKEPSIMFFGLIHDAASFSPPHIFEAMAGRDDTETLYRIATEHPLSPWTDIEGYKIPSFIDDFRDKAGITRKEVLEPIRDKTSLKAKIGRGIDNLDAAALGDSKTEFSRRNLKKFYEKIEIWTDNGIIFIPEDTPTPTGEPIDEFLLNAMYTQVTCYGKKPVVIKDSALLVPGKRLVTARGKKIKDRYGRDFDIDSLYLMEDLDWPSHIDQLGDELSKELMQFAYSSQPDFDDVSPDYGVRDIVVKGFNGVDSKGEGMDSETRKAIEEFQKASQLENMVDVDRRIYEKTGIPHVAVSALIKMPESIGGIYVERHREPISLPELYNLKHRNGVSTVAFIAVYGQKHHSPEIPRKENQYLIRTVLADKGFSSFLAYHSKFQVI